MKLKHPNIESQLFKLLSVHELDIMFEGPDDDNDSFSLRIELFQSQSDSSLYRYRSYRTDAYSLKPQFPTDLEEDFRATVFLFVGYGQRYFPEIDDFNADSPEDALSEIINRLNKSMEHITRKKIDIEEGG